MQRIKTTSFMGIALLAGLAVSCGSEAKKADTGNETTDSAPPEKAEKDTFTVFARVEFPSKDGLMITGDSYEVIPGNQYILLCHQAGFSRGEYRETAMKLTKMGFNCLAIDLRSGEKCNDIINETAQRATARGQKPSYLDAEQDIEAAIDYIYNLTFDKTKTEIILVGSSYTAALALKIAAGNDKLMAVAAFSPGEYLDVKLAPQLKSIDIPVYATSSLEENKSVVDLLAGVDKELVTIYKPTVDGDHGSRVLWTTNAASAEYWRSFTDFLEKLKTSGKEI